MSVCLSIYLSNGILLSPEKEGNLAIWENMDGILGHYVKEVRQRKPNMTSLIYGIEQPGPHRNRE